VAYPTRPIHALDVATGLRFRNVEDPAERSFKNIGHVVARHSLGGIQAETPDTRFQDDALLTWPVADAIVPHEHDPTAPASLR
jgi:hypothetical protein